MGIIPYSKHTYRKKNQQYKYTRGVCEQARHKKFFQISFFNSVNNVGKWVFLGILYYNDMLNTIIMRITQMNGDISSFFSCIFINLYGPTYNYMRIQPNFTYDMIITLLCAVIYAYICSMVKDRLRVMNHDSYARICAHTSTARKCGAPIRTRIASVTLAYHYL